MPLCILETGFMQSIYTAKPETEPGFHFAKSITLLLDVFVERAASRSCIDDTVRYASAQCIDVDLLFMFNIKRRRNCM